MCGDKYVHCVCEAHLVLDFMKFRTTHENHFFINLYYKLWSTHRCFEYY